LLGHETFLFERNSQGLGALFPEQALLSIDLRDCKANKDAKDFAGLTRLVEVNACLPQELTPEQRASLRLQIRRKLQCNRPMVKKTKL